MAVEELTFVFKHGTLGADFVLQRIEAMLLEYQVPSTGFTLYEEPLNLAEVSTHLKKAGRQTFNLVGRGYVIDLSSVRNFQLDFLGIKTADEKRIPWNDWASNFIGNPNFVMAWLADVEYEFWQNAQDPVQYTTKNRDFAHLPKKSNGLPPPLEQTIVDTSSNPGRRLLREGYYEVVGAVMWLGDAFWQLTKTDKFQIENTEWLRVSKPLPTVMRVEAAPNCFTADKGASGSLQHRLRRLLFQGLDSTTQT
jgi:hypothetical protein